MQTITQSLIKELAEYRNQNACGLQVEAKYVNNIEFPSSDAMKLGQWFEYKCTGQKTKFGHIPEPVRNKPKKITQKQLKEGMTQEDIIGELSKKYQDALHHVEAFKQMIEAEDYEIISTGTTLHNKKLNIKGDIDIIVRKRGEETLRFIDTKFSGLMDNKWDDLGWADESLEYKDKLMIQAVHYKLLGLDTYGYMPEFYFWVFSSTNTTDRKNIRVVVDDDRFREHGIIIKNTRAYFERSVKQGWTPRPNPKRCGDCPLREKCEHAVSLPKEQVVYY
jgi:CRISPR/Cas system-associated exonuclease Cas4 (RecB family)